MVRHRADADCLGLQPATELRQLLSEEAGPADVTTAGDVAVDDPPHLPQCRKAAARPTSRPRSLTPGYSPTQSDSPRVDAGTISYSTTFPLAETPISESGRWIHRGIPWALVDAAGGVGTGTQPGDGSYTDWYARPLGLSADQTVTVTVHLNAGLSPGGTREVDRWLGRYREQRARIRVQPGLRRGVRRGSALERPARQLHVRISAGKRRAGRRARRGRVQGADRRHLHHDLAERTAAAEHVDVSSIGGMVWSDGDAGMGFWRGAGASATPGDYGFRSYSAASIP